MSQISSELRDRIQQVIREGQEVRLVNPYTKEFAKVNNPEDVYSHMQRWGTDQATQITFPKGTKGSGVLIDNFAFSPLNPLIQREINNIYQILQAVFPEYNIPVLVNAENPPIFLIKNLPVFYWGYTPNFVDVLIILPEEYPVIPPGLTPQSGIYLPKNLQRNGKPLKCKDDFHSDCNHTPQEIKDLGFAWLCLQKYENWRPPYADMVSVISNFLDILANRLGK